MPLNLYQRGGQAVACPLRRKKRRRFYGSVQQEQGQTFPYVESGLLLPGSAAVLVRGHHHRGDGIRGRIRLRRNSGVGAVRQHESAVQRIRALRPLGGGRRVASHRHRAHHRGQDREEQARAHPHRRRGGVGDDAPARGGDGPCHTRHSGVHPGRDARGRDSRKLRRRERALLHPHQRELDAQRQVREQQLLFHHRGGELPQHLQDRDVRRHQERHGEQHRQYSRHVR